MVRVKPEAEADFVEKFARDMRDQLSVGPYFLLWVTPIENEKKRATKVRFTT